MTAVEEEPRLPVAWARLVRAPNPGPMTLEGTNTWVLRGPGSAAAVVVDPGPDHTGHLEAVAALGPVALTVLTHGHHDHSEGAGRFADLTGSDVVARDPALCRGADPLDADGEWWEAGGVRLMTVLTPGHSADSVCLVAEVGGSRVVLTGDTVLGRGTTVVAHPSGRLGDYLDSLRRLERLGRGSGEGLAGRRLPVLPGHGPVRPDVAEAAAGYLAHRAERLREVRAALEAGARTPREVVEVVYADVDPVLWPAAEVQVEAALVHLRETGQVGSP